MSSNIHYFVHECKCGETNILRLVLSEKIKLESWEFTKAININKKTEPDV